jgi:hypothetical protein
LKIIVNVKNPINKPEAIKIHFNIFMFIRRKTKPGFKSLKCFYMMFVDCTPAVRQIGLEQLARVYGL